MTKAEKGRFAKNLPFSANLINQRSTKALPIFTFQLYNYPQLITTKRDAIIAMKREVLEELVRIRMPFGRYKSMPIIDLPESYIIWLRNKGFPESKLGYYLELVYEIKLNGLESLLTPLRKKNHN